jgi:hypothetical protein
VAQGKYLQSIWLSLAVVAVEQTLQAFQLLVVPVVAVLVGIVPEQVFRCLHLLR